MHNIVHHIARAIIIDQEHILVCQNLKHTFYFLPGGHIEHGETPEEAICREMLEETGASITIHKTFKPFEHSCSPLVNQLKCHYDEINYVFLVDSPELRFNKPLEQRENHIRLSWLPLNQLNEYALEPKKMLPLIKDL